MCGWDLGLNTSTRPSVGVIASSYADEFIGKLFIDIGPIAFNLRIRLVNMSSIVQNLLGRAILQRTYQLMSTTNS